MKHNLKHLLNCRKASRATTDCRLICSRAFPLRPATAELIGRQYSSTPPLLKYCNTSMSSLFSGMIKTSGEEPRIPLPSNAGAAESSPEISASSASSKQTTLQAVEYAMGKIAPLSLADTSWDNVGTLLEAPEPRSGKGVFLAIDLTPAVTDELLSDANSTVSVAIIYHPPIFKALKSLTFSSSSSPNPLITKSLLRLASAGISIYCPHTSLDAAPNGINDWLAYCVSSNDWFERAGLAGLRGVWTPIVKTKVPQYLEKAGMGRLVKLSTPCTITTVIDRLKKHLGLKHGGCSRDCPRQNHDLTFPLPYSVQVAQAQPRDHQIETIAVCAGSGGSVFGTTLADLCESGKSVWVMCRTDASLAILQMSRARCRM
jgi:putative NIF3 family GTP cyclohydrolase 1 type 2